MTFYYIGFLWAVQNRTYKNNKQNEALQSKSVEQNTEEYALAWKSILNANHPLVRRWCGM